MQSDKNTLKKCERFIHAFVNCTVYAQNIKCLGADHENGIKKLDL